jgi:outer membrane protein assembly factor BamD (BamD/ComL family)
MKFTMNRCGQATWLLVGFMSLSAACSVWPNGNVSSEPRDKMLYEKAMSALERNRLDVANLTLQTLVNTYPDSEYASKAQILLDERIAKCGESFHSDPQCSGKVAIVPPTD